MTDSPSSSRPSGQHAVPSLAELTRVFGRIGVLSFGGPAAQIALMHRELVELRGWMTERAFLGALSFCMLLPGPEAMQLCTYAGWRLRGIPGGIIAGTLFVAPGALVILALALLYANYGAQPFVQDAFLGVKAAVIVIVLQALVKVSRKALNGTSAWALAVLAFLAIYAFAVPFPLVVVAAAAWGALAAGSALSGATQSGITRTPAETLSICAVLALLWAAPLVAAWVADAEFLLAIGLFFSKLAIVTFGGAYAVLAYMTQEVVQVQGWLTTTEMIDALGLAETTPGPLILVTEFVAALAGVSVGGWPMGIAAAVLALWVTFIPCFLWIFGAAPYVEWLTAQPRLRGALDGITAAVVGVVANLSLWFALHVFFSEVTTLELGLLQPAWPDPGTFVPVAAALFALATLLLAWRLSLPATLAVMAVAGLVAGNLA